jgi:SNF2 family DNA or RNA helicase
VTATNNAKTSSESTPKHPRFLTEFRQYQHHATQFVKEAVKIATRGRGGCALWVDMGLGKTVILLTAILELLQELEVEKVLVIAPLRVARKTWRDEINAWAHTKGLRISHIIGDPKQRKQGIKADADIYTINRENTKWLVDLHVTERKVLHRWRWDTVVLDESTSFKSGGKKGSNRWLALSKIRRLFGPVIELTGTPRPNGLMDIWAQIYLIDKGERLGKTLTAFRDRWFNPPGYNQFKWKPKDHAEEEIKDLISDICLSLREKDYLELPPVVPNYIPVHLSDDERDQYRTLQRKYIVKIKDKKITAVNAGVLAQKLLQLANGAVYTKNPEWVAFHEAKIDALMELLEFLEGPIMICYNFKSDLARIKAVLTKAKVNWDVLTDEKSEDRWNEGKTDVLLLHPMSAGHGCNLHHSGAEHLIWFGLNWNLEFYLQANARLAGGHRREGRSVVIHHIFTEGTADDDVICGLEEKDDGQERMLDAMRKRVLKYAA